MTKTERLGNGLTRRSFLKTTAIATGAALAGSSLAIGEPQPPTAWAEGFEAREATEPDKVCNCVCYGNDSQHCAFKVSVKDDKIVRVERAEKPNECKEFNRGCLRGLAMPARIYSEERIQYPMLRVEGSARGTQEFERISWDEALDLLAEKISEAKAEFGDGSVMVFQTGPSGFFNSSSMFGKAINSSGNFDDRDAATTASYYPLIGNKSKWQTSDLRTTKFSKAIIFWGDAATEGRPNSFHFFREAQEAGTKMVVVDPQYIPACEHADLWVPIRPGSDSAMYMGIMNIIFEKDAAGEDVIDYDYLRSYTVAPFLVREDTGEFLRPADLGIEAPEDEKFAYIVLDTADGQYKTLDAAAETEVWGDHEVEGIACTTALELLRRKMADYTIDRVSEITEVSPEMIQELADICMDGPVYHRISYASSIYDNGQMIVHAGLTMAALTGNFGRLGSNFATNRNATPLYNASTSIADPQEWPERTSVMIPGQWTAEVMETGKLPYRGDDYPIKVFIACAGNFFNGQSDSNAWERGFANVPFICTVDVNFNDAVLYSDLILPAAEWWEKEEVSLSGEFLNAQFSDQAITPLFEARPESEIFYDLAKRLGVEQYLERTFEEYFDQTMSDYTKKDVESFANLKEKKFIPLVPPTNIEGYYVAWDSLDFQTDSHRIEFYTEHPKSRLDWGQPYPEYHLPEWIEPMEVFDDELRAKYPFVFLSRRSYFEVHANNWNNAYLREIDPEPYVQINPTDAEQYGFTDDEYYEFYNDRGSVVAKLKYDAGIRPGTLTYPKGRCVKHTKAGRFNSLVNGHLDPFAIDQSYNDCLVGIREWKEN